MRLAFPAPIPLVRRSLTRGIVALVIASPCACAQSGSSGYPAETAEASAPAEQASAEAGGPGSRDDLYSGTYFLTMETGNSGSLLLQVNDDGTAMIIPKDVNAAGTGTIDADGNIDVTTGYDSFADGEPPIQSAACNVPLG